MIPVSHGPTGRSKASHALFGRIGAHAKMPFPIHPHMLRHGCGYALANAGHDTRALQAYLGHKNIQHTVRYTELAPDRFKDLAMMRYPNSSRTASTAITSNATAIAATPNGPRAPATNFRLVRIHTH
jgi:integrase